ncbi:MAG: hypothetical protein HY794_01070 [Desulfarculus sp.]|nr:hypothetical protein [Desulfarculus sp.]
MSQDDVLARYAAHVGYSAEDLTHIPPGDPRARHIGRLARAALRYSIQAQVVAARHCNSGYQMGDSFLLDVDGNFIAKHCPKRLCVYLMSQLVLPVALINERLSEGLEPSAIHFTREVNCPDVGVECLGYGQVRLKVAVVPRQHGQAKP